MGRIVLVDILRCMAIIAMIVFHIAYDLAVFYNYPIDYEHGVWYFIQAVLAGGLFIFVSGWTASLGRRSGYNLAQIGMAAVLVSLVTYYQFGDMYVRFGILHFMFVANLIYTLLLRYASNYTLSTIALGSALAMPLVRQQDVDHIYLSWLDILPVGYQSVDHYPLVPWLGVFIMGIIWGRSSVADQVRTVGLNICARNYITSCSKHSLAIYILHQPVIVGLLIVYHRYL